MISSDKIDKAASFARDFHSKDGSGHDWFHVWRVWQLAKHIAQQEQVNVDLVELAALLHDMDDWKLQNFDGKDMPNARSLLLSLDVNVELIERVVEIIKETSFKGAKVNTKPTSIEACVVQDADRLDAIGAIGVARAFAYGGSKTRLLYDPNIKPNLHNSFEEYKKAEGTTLNHFYEKLLLLKDLLNTETAKTIAIQRHQFMEQFVEQFLDEWNLRDIERGCFNRLSKSNTD